MSACPPLALRAAGAAAGACACDDRALLLNCGWSGADARDRRVGANESCAVAWKETEALLLAAREERWALPGWGDRSRRRS